jgi:chromosome segregation ATPase
VVNLQNELTQKNKQITDLQTQLQKEQSDKKVYTQSNEKYKNDLVEKDKMISALSNIKVPIDQKGLTNLQSELAQKNNQITGLQTQLQKAQADNQNYAQSIQKLQTDLSEKNKQITVLGGKNTTADQKALLSLQNTVNEKNKKIADLENQAKAEKQIYTETISSLQNELIEKNKIIASAGGRKVPTDEKAVVTLQNEIAEKDKRIRRLEDQLKSNTPASGETIKDLQQKNSSLRLAYNNSMTQLGTLQKKYNSLKSEMEGLRSQR